MRGPVAPKDPTKQRAKVYFMLEDLLYASHKAPQGDRYAEMIFLENRVSQNLRLICPELPEELGNRLQKTNDFREIVHSIGIIAENADGGDPEREVTCELQHYATTDRYSDGTRMTMEVCCDGAERVFPLSEFDWKEHDDILGTFFLFSDEQNVKIKLTVILYLQDGYTAPEPQLDPPIDYESDAYREMIAHSLLSMGNTHRLRRAIEKAERGEDVTLAFIGGSITQGAGAKPIETESYCYRTFAHFRDTYATDPEKVHLVKAGVGGTPSEFGLVRYEHDVLRDGTVEPDIVFIEFSVNDAGDETNGVCFESLLAKAYNRPNMPAVILVFAVFMNDWNLQDRLAPIGEHYQVPMVSVKDAVSPQFPDAENRVISKRQYFYDCYHPTNDGHRVMADCIDHLIEQSLAHVDEEPEWPAEGCLGRPYENCYTVTRDTAEAFADRVQIDAGSFTEVDTALQYAEMDYDAFGTPQFPNNWMRTEGDRPFVIKATCRNLFITYKDSGEASFGAVTVTVDGRFCREINSREIGWNHCNTYLLVNDDTVAPHEIKISMKDAENAMKFTIFAVTLTEK
ncbi:MAG: SGNH/GDSL hydrolase family protein [Lachnospiraceae bacterium]|nr:SGNH/GDSL hydrolase family protein [Lachnospiraceae bacterium]